MQPDNRLIQTIDNLIQETYPPTQPGAAVIVVRDGEIIFRKGQGMANLELGVPIEPDMVFRLGSITKQFTAVAILMLAEQGKLALDDAITKFLPDYPTHDHLITVEHLLTHTSGIKSYTDMPEWPPLWRKDFTVQELIDFFKYQPMQFAPGKRWAYSNSGYILLGAILEKVSGQTYEQFLQQSIFDPLRMKQSYYDSPLRVIPRRVAGYDKGPEGYTNAAYLSMTQPYAAGALASTVDDLAIWDSALYTDQLLKHETLQRAFISYRLMDGSSTAYGYGWAILEYEGHLLIEHGGGIHGFRTHAIRMPADRVFMAILSNNGGADPEQLAFKIAALVIGQPYKEPTSIELSPEVLTRYEGVYKINASEERRITREDNRLFSQRGRGQLVELVPLSSNEFFFKDMSLYHLRFVSDANEVVIAVEMRGRSGIPELAKKVDKSALGTS
jgi:CubicO group peptidase (beta-lactamase class C family)